MPVADSPKNHPSSSGTEILAQSTTNEVPQHSSSWGQIVNTERAFRDATLLSTAHSNLDNRLKPFWRPLIANKKIDLQVFTNQYLEEQHLEGPMTCDQPLYRTTLVCDTQGHFSETLVIPWEALCNHPPSLLQLFPQMPSGSGKGGSPWLLSIVTEVSGERSEGDDSPQLASSWASSVEQAPPTPGSHRAAPKEGMSLLQPGPCLRVVRATSCDEQHRRSCVRIVRGADTVRSSA